MFIYYFQQCHGKFRKSYEWTGICDKGALNRTPTQLLVLIVYLLIKLRSYYTTVGSFPLEFLMRVYVCVGKHVKNDRSLMNCLPRTKLICMLQQLCSFAYVMRALQFINYRILNSFAFKCCFNYCDRFRSIKYSTNVLEHYVIEFLI